MRVRDLAAELVSEIADDLGYHVYKYECSAPSCGHIVYELEVEKEDTLISQYKILDYSGYEVYLLGPDKKLEINLHEPKSIEQIREWFEDDAKTFPHPLGSLLGGYGTWPNYGSHTHQIGNGYGSHTHQMTSGHTIVLDDDKLNHGKLMIGTGAHSHTLSISDNPGWSITNDLSKAFHINDSSV